MIKNKFQSRKTTTKSQAMTSDIKKEKKKVIWKYNIIIILF